MGMGYGANYADTISENDIKKVKGCKQLYTNLRVALENANKSMEILAQNMESYGELEEALDEMFGEERKESKESIKHFYEKLTDEFRKNTGMELCLGYHDQNENGDRYDDVDGVYWWVDGYWTVSKAGKEATKKYGIAIERQAFVTFG